MERWTASSSALTLREAELVPTLAVVSQRTNLASTRADPERRRGRYAAQALNL
jgi:hypothetical protein